MDTAHDNQKHQGDADNGHDEHDERDEQDASRTRESVAANQPAESGQGRVVTFPHQPAPSSEQATTPATPVPQKKFSVEVVEEAVTLYCQGLTIASVARKLNVAETTARRWIRLGLATLASDARAERRLELQRLIESQRAIARAAWEAYREERQERQEQFAQTEQTAQTGEATESEEANQSEETQDTEATDNTRNCGKNGNAGQPEHVNSGKNGNVGERKDASCGKNGKSGNSLRPPLPLAGEGLGEGPTSRNRGKNGKPGKEEKAPMLHPPYASRVPQGARFLALALAAQREVARLQGLFEKLAEEPAPAMLTIVQRPAGPENQPPALPSGEAADDTE